MGESDNHDSSLPAILVQDEEERLQAEREK